MTGPDGDPDDGVTDDDAPVDGRRVWLVERTYGDDEQNLIVLVYATLDGSRYVRKERALTSFADDRPTRASISVDADDLAAVEDPDERERLSSEARRTAERYGPHEAV